MPKDNKQISKLKDQLSMAEEQRGLLEGYIVDAHFRAFGARHYAYVDCRSACDLLVADITATQHERDVATARAEAAEKELAEVKNALMVSEQYRRSYANGKYALYSMGGEITEAAAKHLPCSEGPLDRYTQQIEREHSPLLVQERASLIHQLDAATAQVESAEKELAEEKERWVQEREAHIKLKAECLALEERLANANVGIEEDGNKYLVSRWTLAEQLIAATAQVADLRAALEEIMDVLAYPDETIWISEDSYVISISYPDDDETRFNAAKLHVALARTPSQSLAAHDAAVLRKAWQKVCAAAVQAEEKECRTFTWSDAALIVEAEADHIEAEAKEETV